MVCCAARMLLIGFTKSTLLSPMDNTPTPNSNMLREQVRKNGVSLMFFVSAR